MTFVKNNPKYITLLHFSFWPEYRQTIIMVKGVGCVYKYSQRNCT